MERTVPNTIHDNAQWSQLTQLTLFFVSSINRQSHRWAVRWRIARHAAQGSTENLYTCKADPGPMSPKSCLRPPFKFFAVALATFKILLKCFAFSFFAFTSLTRIVEDARLFFPSRADSLKSRPEHMSPPWPPGPHHHTI